MATETLFPDGLVSSVNYVSPALSDFDDDPDTTTDYGDWDGNGNTDVLLDFPTPTGNPNIGADLQTIRAAARKVDATGENTPEWSLGIWEAGVLVSVIATGSLADNTDKQIISGTFNANILGTADGSALQVKILQTAGGTGGPTARRGLEVGGVEWQVDYSAGEVNVPVTGIAATGSVGTATVEGKANVPVTGLEATSAIGSVLVSAEANIITGGLGATASVGTVTVDVGAATWEQEGFRFRNDDGTEITATWVAAQDTNATLEAETNFRLRVTSVVTGDPDPAAATLQYRKVGDSVWQTIQ